MKKRQLKLKSFVWAFLFGSQALLMNACVSNVNETPPPPVVVDTPAFAIQVVPNHFTRTQVVFTLAGNGTTGYVDGTNDIAKFNTPSAVASDAFGNVFVADALNHRIRKIGPAGTVSTLAGNGNPGFADGSGSAAQFNAPSGLATDAAGNIYVADKNNHRIRKISPAGVVTTLAGNGSQGFTDGPGISARFNLPAGVAVDASGNVYVADGGNNRIRKINISGTTVSVITLAGNGTAGSANGTGSFAQFNAPSGIAVNASNTVFVADGGNHKIRKITGSSMSTSIVSTLAGGGSAGVTSGYLDGTGTAALFKAPADLAIDTAGNLFVADKGNNRVRKIEATGVVTTLAGNGLAGFADGGAAQAQFNQPVSIASDKSGNLYVADLANQRVREVTFSESGTVSTFAGSAFGGFMDAVGTAARFNGPVGLVTDTSGNVYVADYYNHRIRKITPDGTVTTFAGSATYGSADGPANSATFQGPTGLAIDASGNIYVADQLSNKIRKITAQGVVTTLAGTGGRGYADGPGNIAQFSGPTSVTVDGSGNVYVCDNNNYRIRKISPSGTVSTLAGNGKFGYVDGPASIAEFQIPAAVASDPVGNVYVTEEGAGRIRKITPAGLVSTFVGNNGYADGIGRLSLFFHPFSMAMDRAGNFYVTDYSNYRIRKITPSGVVTTLAGSGVRGYTDGPGPSAQFVEISGIAADAFGNVYVSEGSTRIRKIQ